MAYKLDGGKWVWEGPGLEPTIGETKEQFVARGGVLDASLDISGIDLDAGTQTPDLPDIQERRPSVAVSTYEGERGGAGPFFNGGGDMSNGVDLYGRAGVVTNGGGVPVGGPGVPEPPAAMVAKHWTVMSISPRAATFGLGAAFNVHHWLLIDGRRMSFNPLSNQWKMWRPKKPLAVLYRGKVTLSQAIKVQKYLDKMWSTVAKKTKQLKLQTYSSRKK